MLFPFLKLEFSKKIQHGGALAVRLPLLNINKTIGECRTVYRDGSIIINPQMTVSQLEKEFSEIYGLTTQVFRKSGNIWLVTTVTDKWTLEEQNNQGEIITRQMNERKSKLGSL